MPTGWRPEGLAPRAKKGWKHDGREVKFQSTPINGSKAYLVAHVALTFPVMLLVTRPDSPLTTWDKVLLSLVLWLAATSWSAILESRRFALPLEAGRLVLQAALLGSFTLRGMLPTTAGALTLSIAAASLLWVATRTRPTALLPVAAERPGS